jgi:stage II sporulation protein D
MRAPAAACLAVVALALALAAPAAADTSFEIDGGGDGHGIGMSQYGAYGYALHGKDYRFILGHYYRGTTLAGTNPLQIVRVLLSSGSASFSGASYARGKKLDPNTTYSVHALANGSLQLYDQGGKKIGPFKAPLSVGGSRPLSLASHGLYRGWLEFRTAAGGSSVQTVNALHLEDYVRGVVSAEMPSSWAPEALKAQAVAARTYAITSTVNGSGYQLYQDTRSQMYTGVSAETPSTDAAVAGTRGQIVAYRGAPAITYFFSSSGGYTENVENVWLGSTPEPWLKGVPDPYDGVGGNPDHRWSYKLTTEAATAMLGRLVKGTLVGITVTRHGVSPRIVSAQVVGTGGRTDVTGPQLQSAFGLLSTYASFATISSASGIASGSSRRVLIHGRQGAAEVGFEVLAIHGRVFGAKQGSAVAIQRHTGHGWRTVRRVGLGAGGSYVAALPQPGSYRVVYRRATGPVVGVG